MGTVAVIRDFYCGACGAFKQVVPPSATSTDCKNCGKSAGMNRPLPQGQAPALIGEIRNGFNEHYDLQLGQHFSSAEQKKDFLTKTNRLQYNGQSSPRRDSKTVFRCTKKQADKEFGIVKDPKPLQQRCTNEELK